jgi:hypothetical protein
MKGSVYRALAASAKQTTCRDARLLGARSGHPIQTTRNHSLSLLSRVHGPAFIPCSSRPRKSDRRPSCRKKSSPGACLSQGAAPVSNLFYRSFRSLLHHLLTEWKALLAQTSLSCLPFIVGCAVAMPSEALAQTHKDRGPQSRPRPLLNISSAFALSSFTAATARSSMALASSAVPN